MHYIPSNQQQTLKFNFQWTPPDKIGNSVRFERSDIRARNVVFCGSIPRRYWYL